MLVRCLPGIGGAHLQSRHWERSVRAGVREDVLEFIVSNYLFGDVRRAPRDDESLIESGVVDSTGILELIEFLESRFDIQIDESETLPTNLDSVSNLVSFVGRKKAGSE